MAKKPTDDKPAFQADRQQGETDAQAMARTALRPTLGAALTARTFGVALGENRSGPDLTALVAELSAQCGKVSAGDLSRPEAMLTAQAHALDAIFHSLAHRAANNIGHYPDTVERYMKLALRAQSQCRATLETLATIKNPPVVIAKQANIAQGHQQVNNDFCSSTRTGARTREIQSEPSKLLEQTHGDRLDTEATSRAGRSDPAMATVGEVHRPENGDR